MHPTCARLSGFRSAKLDTEAASEAEPDLKQADPFLVAKHLRRLVVGFPCSQAPPAVCSLSAVGICPCCTIARTLPHAMRASFRGFFQAEARKPQAKPDTLHTKSLRDVSFGTSTPRPHIVPMPRADHGSWARALSALQPFCNDLLSDFLGQRILRFTWTLKNPF